MSQKRLAALLACGMIAFSGCAVRNRPEAIPSEIWEPEPSSVQEVEESEADAEESEPEEDVVTVAEILPDFTAQVAEKSALNSDTAAWLQVPGTDISDVVLHKPDDTSNEYYSRLSFTGQYDFHGVYYADYRSDFGDGTREGLGTATCIYGHSLTDDPSLEHYGVRFGPLHDFRDPERAREMPYLFLSTEKENMAFEVIAVYLCNADNPALPYNGNLSGEAFVRMVEEEILPRSLYRYDAEITEEDKFLSLSTCIYSMQDGTKLNYLNSQYRYVILGKLVEPDAPLKEEAVFTLNENPVVDPVGKWRNSVEA